MCRCPLSPHKHTQMLIMYAQTYTHDRKTIHETPWWCGAECRWFHIYSKAIRGITSGVPAGGWSPQQPICLTDGLTLIAYDMGRPQGAPGASKGHTVSFWHDITCCDLGWGTTLTAGNVWFYWENQEFTSENHLLYLCCCGNQHWICRENQHESKVFPFLEFSFPSDEKQFNCCSIILPWLQNNIENIMQFKIH